MKMLGKRWVNAIERSKDIGEWVPFVSEIATDSRMKYALDKRSGQLALHRALADGITYPTNYGFVPRTLSAADGMEVDLMALSSEPLLPLTIARARLLGGCSIQSADEDRPEDKLLGVILNDPRCTQLHELADVDDALIQRIERFFTTYKQDQQIEVKIVRWFDRATAVEKVKKALRAYRK